jgi:hypothetical protein
MTSRFEHALVRDRSMNGSENVLPASLGGSAEPTPGRPTILVVDDDQANLLAIEVTLEDIGTRRSSSSLPSTEKRKTS